MLENVIDAVGITLVTSPLVVLGCGFVYVVLTT